MESRARLARVVVVETKPPTYQEERKSQALGGSTVKLKQPSPSLLSNRREPLNALTPLGVEYVRMTLEYGSVTRPTPQSWFLAHPLITIRVIACAG